MALCGTCPDAVVRTLRRRVNDALGQVRAIRSLSGAFSRVLQDVAGLAADEVSSAVNGIPTVPGIGLDDILGYLTCPLTPLAIALEPEDFEALDPRVQLSKLKELIGSEVDAARASYEGALDNSVYAGVLSIARRYANEFIRIGFDEVVFAEAILVAASVLALCGEEEYTSGGYVEFANEIEGFSLTGGLPSDMDPNTAAVTQRLIEGETKLKALQTALVTL